MTERDVLHHGPHALRLGPARRCETRDDPAPGPPRVLHRSAGSPRHPLYTVADVTAARNAPEARARREVSSA
ncbi:hypothetical protein ACVNF4_06525 [Streptomyces sp. S6]